MPPHYYTTLRTYYADRSRNTLLPAISHFILLAVFITGVVYISKDPHGRADMFPMIPSFYRRAVNEIVDRGYGNIQPNCGHPEQGNSGPRVVGDGVIGLVLGVLAMGFAFCT